MSQSSGESGGGPDFHLPDEVLAVIPTDPYDQLDLARKITSMAIASRVSKLETETGTMRQMLYEKDRLICELEERLSHVQKVYQEADSKLKIFIDDNAKLAKERDSLAMTVRNLSRDLAKLETFKRQLMQSLNDDNSSHSASFTAKPFQVLNTAQRFSLTPYITPRLTPTGTPKVISTSVSPRGYSVAGSPKRTSGTMSPTKTQNDGRISLSSWYPSSQQSSAANSPPRGRRTPRIDGKEFFRQARSRLSYEQFSAFLASIKELNAQKQTREETLRKAEEIFGTDNKDLYLYFQGLLNRNVH
ncbi:hypothetical protein KPL70_024850 [Citrus sinensis]|nr:hypothetical protein KPL70_024850 [Citrus sinensis]